MRAKEGGVQAMHELRELGGCRDYLLVMGIIMYGLEASEQFIYFQF